MGFNVTEIYALNAKYLRRCFMSYVIDRPYSQVTETHNVPLSSTDNTDNTNQEGTSSDVQFHQENV